MIVKVKHSGQILTFFTAIGSHLLAEISGSFLRRHLSAKAILVDNGVYHLLRHGNIISPRELVKYATKNIMRYLNFIRNRDADVYIVIPDYFADAKINHQCYELFVRHYRYLRKHYKLVYVLHGYWQAVLDGVDVDLVAIPFNTLSDIPIRDLRGRRTCRLDAFIGKYVLLRTIEHVKRWGYDKVHLLGPSGLTLKRIFRPVNKLVALDGTTIDDSELRHVTSFDTTSFHMASVSRVRKIDYGKGLYMIPNRDDEVELAWLREWLSRLTIFELVSL